MKALLVVILSLWLVDVCFANGASNCTNYERLLDTLPGDGWDSLRNVREGRIFDIAQYSQCAIATRHKYLIPNTVTMLPRMVLDHKSSHVIENTTDYTDERFEHINADGHLNVHIKGLGNFSLNGRFSADYMDNMEHHWKETEITVQSHLKYTLYTIRMKNDVRLHPVFKNQLERIALKIRENKPQMAKYYSQLLIRDYGTHFIKSVDAGALVVKNDYFYLDELSNTKLQKDEIKGSATVDLMNLVKIDFGFRAEGPGTSTKTVEMYKNHRKTYKIKSYGGKIARDPGDESPPAMTSSQWLHEIEDHMTNIDRSGNPIYLAVDERSLPGMSKSLVKKVHDSVKEAVDEYMRQNTHQGCTSIISERFDPKANVNDGNNCKPNQPTSYLFGGTYILCQNGNTMAGHMCNEIEAKNEKTGGFSCPQGFSPTQLYNGTTSKQQYRGRQCKQRGGWWLIKPCKRYAAIYHRSDAMYQVYWCHADTEAFTKNEDTTIKQQYYFGGYYSLKDKNPMTKTRKCPNGFRPHKFGRTAKLCLSSSKFAQMVAWPIAGFYGCQSVNTLTGQKSCPQGYEARFIHADDSCEINVCATPRGRSHAKVQIKRPPFIALPGSGSTNSPYVERHKPILNPPYQPPEKQIQPEERKAETGEHD